MLAMHCYLTDNSTLMEMMEQQQKCCNEWRRQTEATAWSCQDFRPASAKTSSLVKSGECFMLIYVMTPQDLIHNEFIRYKKHKIYIEWKSLLPMSINEPIWTNAAPQLFCVVSSWALLLDFHGISVREIGIRKSPAKIQLCCTEE